MRKVDYEPAPLIMAFILGPVMEQALRQSMSIFHGQFTVFFTRPICIGALGLALVLIASNFTPLLKTKRSKLIADLAGDKD